MSGGGGEAQRSESKIKCDPVRRSMNMRFHLLLKNELVMKKGRK